MISKAPIFWVWRRNMYLILLIVSIAFDYFLYKSNTEKVMCPVQNLANFITPSFEQENKKIKHKELAVIARNKKSPSMAEAFVFRRYEVTYFTAFARPAPALNFATFFAAILIALPV